MKYSVIITSIFICVLGIALFSGSEKELLPENKSYNIKQIQISPETKPPKIEEKVVPELFNDQNYAFSRAKELRKHLVLWINEFDHELYMEMPEAVHVKVTSYGNKTSGTVICCLKNDGQFHELIDLTKDNSFQIQHIALNKFNLPYIKEFLKNPK
jgi:hypothetical protein